MIRWRSNPERRPVFPDSAAPGWAVPLLLAAVAIFLYWKILFTSRATFPWDFADFFYPCLSFVHEELRHFRLPLWDPYVMSGYPIIGDMEAQIFYPLNWLFLVFSPASPLPFRMVEAQAVFHFFLAGLFMFYLARDVTGETVPSLLGGVLFMSSGAMVAHTQHLAIVESMAWYPLVFLAARRALLSGRTFWTIAAGLVYGVQLLAGHWQHSVYMGLLLFLYFAWHAVSRPGRAKFEPRWIGQLLLIAAIGAGLALIQVLPSTELGFQSIRTRLSYWDITSGNEPSYLWTLFLPNYYGGLHGVPLESPYDLSLVYVFLTVPGLLLALLGLAETLRRRNFFYAGTLAVLVFLSFGRHGPLGHVLYAIPILNRFRNPGMLFDPANFLLCLLAALGAQALFGAKPRPALEKYFPWILAALLLGAGVLGLVHGFGASVHGWYAMLAALALFTLAAAAGLRGWIRPGIATGTVFALLLFQQVYYQRNQMFNASPLDPERYATRDLAIGSPGVLKFLRSDPARDFRVWAAGEHILSTNGWNVWRIPSVGGWNPIVLGSYQNYIQEFIQCDTYTAPHAGGDHELDSPMLDLLGVKYLVSMGGGVSDTWTRSGKLRHVSTDSGWWRIFENGNYLSHAWFYPHAYTVPDPALVLPLMKSRWFAARKTLLFGPEDLPKSAGECAQELSAIHLLPGQVTAASAGRAAADEGCAEPQQFYRDWSGEGNWTRFHLTDLKQPGRYTLLLRYASADPNSAPAIEASVENGRGAQSGSPVVLPRTAQWGCGRQRTAELGRFDLASGGNDITLTLRRATPVDLYSLWLVRLPDEAPAESEGFSFRGFSGSANSISLAADIPENGFLLLNEIYYPGWKATVDGRPAAIRRADGIFRALEVSPGTHRIELRFLPRSFLPGAAGSLATLILALASLALCRRRDRRRIGDIELRSRIRGF